MLRINKKLSVTISFVLAVVAFIFVIGVAAYLPFLNWEHIGTEHVVLYTYPVVLTLLYLILIPPVIADIALLRLLLNVRRSLIFTPQSVSQIRLISWCCFVECVLFLALGACYTLMFVVAFAAAFLGVVLRVVKNVIEEAIDLKTENEFTV